MGLGGTRVLVIGGGSGIGYAVAEAAAAEGAHVVVASTQPEKVRAAAARLGAAAGAELDVTDESAVATFFESQDAFDHIVTTAGDWGALRRTRLADLDLTAAAGAFGVRFWGALAVAKHGGRRLPEGGSLTLTDGMIAHKPAKGSAASTAMAGAIEHLTRALAVELAPARVNCVCPGMIRTGVYEAAPAEQQQAFDRSASRLLIPRLGWPEETAEAYLYLMRGGYTTGQVLFVEGGSALS
jgi:NAD(P)-dependent dehydrogenase (short-subunit alcohol dehydrogenase family)